MTEYYEIVRRKIEPPKPGQLRIATAAVWSCQLCGDTIDGMGGPGHGEICVTCGDAILGRKVRMVRAALAPENKAG